MAKTVIAIMYDFDKTLCTKDMQEFAFIPKLGIKPEEFWAEAQELERREKMDAVNTYLYLMIKKSKEKSLPITRGNFVSLGKSIEYYPGVEDWFDRINAFGEENGVKVEHYVISSGLKEIIEGSSVYKQFKEVYACEFLYDENGVAVWPKLAVNYTNKTQFLFRINKGVLDVADDVSLNRYTKEEDRRIPFRNMIYIGDGLTDVPCMKLVKVNHGQSVAVFKKYSKKTASDLLKEERVDYISQADYTAGGELEKIVKAMIVKMRAEDNLAKMHANHLKSIETKK